jgi:putative ABC transport system permease protein
LSRPIPASFILLYKWIQSYAFRTSLSWWIFVLVPLLVLLITSVLITLQVFFAARRNPADVIKIE